MADRLNGSRVLILEAREEAQFAKLLAEQGAELVADEPVVVDGNFTTSQGMGTAIDFGLALVAHYAGVEAAEALGQGIVYQQ